MASHYLSASSLALVLLLSGCVTSPTGYVAKGDRFLSEGRLADAEINYSKAIQRDLKFGDAYYKLGLLFIKENRAASAYQALRKAVELLPDNMDAKVSLADVCFAIYFQNEPGPKVMYDEAALMASKILEVNPSSADGLRLKGALSLLDRRPTESVIYYRRANELRPMDGEIILGYTQALYRAGQATEAEKLALAFLADHRTFSPVYDALYKQYMDGKRYAEAENVLHQWVENEPKDSTPILKLARHYLSQRRQADAVASLNRMLGNWQNFTLAHLQVGDFYAQNGDWAEAEKAYLDGSRLDLKNVLTYKKKLVAALVAQGKREEALATLDQMHKDFPGDVEVRAQRAQLWSESGKAEKLDAALLEFQAIIKQDPGNAGLRYAAGQAYLRKGNTPDARVSFLEAARLRTDFLPPRLELSQLALNQQQPLEAIRFAEEILKVDPANAAGKLFRSAGLIGANRLPEARAALRELLRDYPQSRDVQLQMGMLEINERKFADAEATFRKLADFPDNDPRVALGLASTYSAQHDYEKSVQVLSTELKKRPDNAILQSLLALTALTAGKYDVAIDNYSRLVAASPRSTAARVNLAEAHRRKGDAKAAITVLEEAKGLEPNNAAAQISLASAFHTLGRLDESRDSLRRCIALQPTNAPGLNNLAFLLVETGGDLNEAQNLSEQALKKDSGNPQFLDTLGWIYLKREKNDNALQIFNGLVKKQPEDPTFRYHLGAALLKTGQKQKARSELELALAKKPVAAERQNINALLAATQ